MAEEVLFVTVFALLASKVLGANPNNDETANDGIDVPPQSDHAVYGLFSVLNKGHIRGMYKLCRQQKESSAIDEYDFKDGMYDVHYCKYDTRGGWPHYGIILCCGDQKWRLHARRTAPTTTNDGSFIYYKKLAGGGPSKLVMSVYDEGRDIILLEPERSFNYVKVLKSLKCPCPITLSYLTHLASKTCRKEGAVKSCVEFADKWWSAIVGDLSSFKHETKYFFAKKLCDLTSNPSIGNYGGSTMKQLGLDRRSDSNPVESTFQLPWASKKKQSLQPSLTPQLKQTFEHTYNVNAYSHYFGELKGLCFENNSIHDFIPDSYNVYFVQWSANGHNPRTGPINHYGILLKNRQEKWVIHATRLRLGVPYHCDTNNEKITASKTDRIYGVVMERLGHRLVYCHGKIPKLLQRKVHVTVDMIRHFIFQTRNAATGELLCRDCHVLADLWFNYFLQCGPNNNSIHSYWFSSDPLTNHFM